MCCVLHLIISVSQNRCNLLCRLSCDFCFKHSTHWNLLSYWIVEESRRRPQNTNIFALLKWMKVLSTIIRCHLNSGSYYVSIGASTWWWWWWLERIVGSACNNFCWWLTTISRAIKIKRTNMQHIYRQALI